MREILFRGKCVETGDWVEGLLAKHPSGAGYNDCTPWYIDVPPADPDDYTRVYNVALETVGQFTGLTDRNGEKIFEGDIVDAAREDEPLVVQWSEDSARFILSASTFCCDFDNYWGYETEVVGNIHDTPCLTEVYHG